MDKSLKTILLSFQCPYWHIMKNPLNMSWFVCLGFFFRLTREFFTHKETSPLPVKVCKDLVCSALMAIEQWGFFSMSHLLWHGHPFIMVISEDPWQSHLMPSIEQWSCHFLFKQLGLSRPEFKHPTFRLRSKHSNRLQHRLGSLWLWDTIFETLNVYCCH